MFDEKSFLNTEKARAPAQTSLSFFSATHSRLLVTALHEKNMVKLQLFLFIEAVRVALKSLKEDNEQED